MLDYLIEDNNLLPVFKEYGLDEQDITFIKEQVAGPNKEFTLHLSNDDLVISLCYVVQADDGD